MSTPFLSEIRIVSFNFPPKGWAFCNGQLLPINQNQALFALVGTTYGGNGITNFSLPNLQGVSPIHQGNGFVLGQTGGESTHTLSVAELAAHTHGVEASSTAADQSTGPGNIWASHSKGYDTLPPTSPASTTQVLTAAIAPAGGNQPHENRPPFTVLAFIIALQGIFPSQN